jgi:putative oxidoreductase
MKDWVANRRGRRFRVSAGAKAADYRWLDRAFRRGSAAPAHAARIQGGELSATFMAHKSVAAANGPLLEQPQMIDTPSFTATWSPRMLAVLRIVTGYIFLLHGSAKVLHVPYVASYDNIEMMSLIGVAGILELVGGLLVLIGAFTRPVAFVLAGQMAVAYFMGHASQGSPLLPLLNRGDAAVLYCFVFLYLAVVGAGAWSFDGARRITVEARRPAQGAMR